MLLMQRVEPAGRADWPKLGRSPTPTTTQTTTLTSTRTERWSTPVRVRRPAVRPVPVLARPRPAGGNLRSVFYPSFLASKEARNEKLSFQIDFIDIEFIVVRKPLSLSRGKYKKGETYVKYENFNRIGHDIGHRRLWWSWLCLGCYE